MDYKHSGVDIEAGYKAVELMKKHDGQNGKAGDAGRTGRFFRSLFHG